MRRYLSAALGGLLAASVSSAGSVVEQWFVSAAIADAFGSNGGHALFFDNSQFPGGGNQYIFDGAPGLLTAWDDDDDGIADELRMTGRLVSTIDSDYAYDLDLVFSARSAGAQSPKKELIPAAYIDNGGPVDPSTWSYWEPAAGSALIGAGAATAGQTLDIWIYPNNGSIPFQLGDGANGKNIEFGLSGGFEYQIGLKLYQGELNVSLIPVPEPGTALALAAGAFLLIGRRRP